MGGRECSCVGGKKESRAKERGSSPHLGALTRPRCPTPPVPLSPASRSVSGSHYPPSALQAWPG